MAGSRDIVQAGGQSNSQVKLPKASIMPNTAQFNRCNISALHSKGHTIGCLLRKFSVMCTPATPTYLAWMF